MANQLATRAPRPMTLLPSAVADWRAPSWLATWTPEHTVPMAAPELNREVSRVAEMLAPARPEEIAVLLEETLHLFALPKHMDWERAAPIYLEALEKFPAWAIADALRTVRLDHEFFPKPAEIRKAMPTQFHEMNLALMKLKTAAMFAQRQRRTG